MLREPLLIGTERAAENILKIDDPIKRSAIQSLYEGVVEFYELHPSQLEGQFDIGFLVEVLMFDLASMSMLLRGIVDEASYWNDELPKPELWPPDHPGGDSGPTGIRKIQGHNYCARHSDAWSGAALLGVLSIIDLKRRLMNSTTRFNPAPGGHTLTPGNPEQPLDYLFLVMALDHALRPEGLARPAVQHVSL